METKTLTKKELREKISKEGDDLSNKINDLLIQFTKKWDDYAFINALEPFEKINPTDKNTIKVRVHYGKYFSEV